MEDTGRWEPAKRSCYIRHRNETCQLGSAEMVLWRNMYHHSDTALTWIWLIDVFGGLTEAVRGVAVNGAQAVNPLHSDRDGVRRISMKTRFLSATWIQNSFRSWSYSTQLDLKSISYMLQTWKIFDKKTSTSTIKYRSWQKIFFHFFLPYHTRVVISNPNPKPGPDQPGLWFGRSTIMWLMGGPGRYWAFN